jgi:hypothetical protein
LQNEDLRSVRGLDHERIDLATADGAKRFLCLHQPRSQLGIFLAKLFFG